MPTPPAERLELRHARASRSTVRAGTIRMRYVFHSHVLFRRRCATCDPYYAIIAEASDAFTATPLAKETENDESHLEWRDHRGV